MKCRSLSTTSFKSSIVVASVRHAKVIVNFSGGMNGVSCLGGR